jgi:hypothetical protein
MAQPEFGYRTSAVLSSDPWSASRRWEETSWDYQTMDTCRLTDASPMYNETSYQNGAFENANSRYRQQR